MKIPSKLKVGAHTFTVRKANARDAEKGSDYWGKTDYSNATITIDNEVQQSKMEEVLLHEILHVCFDHSGLNVKYDRGEEENIVNALSNQLYMILKVNKLI